MASRARGHRRRLPEPGSAAPAPCCGGTTRKRRPDRGRAHDDTSFTRDAPGGRPAVEPGGRCICNLGRAAAVSSRQQSAPLRFAEVSHAPGQESREGLPGPGHRPAGRGSRLAARDVRSPGPQRRRQVHVHAHPRRVARAHLGLRHARRRGHPGSARARAGQARLSAAGVLRWRSRPPAASASRSGARRGTLGAMGARRSPWPRARRSPSPSDARSSPRSSWWIPTCAC